MRVRELEHEVLARWASALTGCSLFCHEGLPPIISTRAAGIHLILATQNPRAQIDTHALKTNLDGRVCLRTASSAQSRMILEQNGAESLLGHGDLFYKTVGKPVRLQAPLLEDVERVELYGQG